MMVLGLGRVQGSDLLRLPKPSLRGEVSVEAALKARRTHRGFTAQQLELRQASQLLWAAYGVSGRKRRRLLKTAPSAGALYPLDVYAVVGEDGVQSLAAGVYHYVPRDHGLELVQGGDWRQEVARAAHGQMWMAQAPMMFLITGEYERCTRKYGDRGIMYTHMEAGCVAQNIFLQAEALGLAAGIVGAFDNRAVTKAAGTPAAHEPLLIMPVGYRR